MKDYLLWHMGVGENKFHTVEKNLAPRDFQQKRLCLGFISAQMGESRITNELLEVDLFYMYFKRANLTSVV